MYHHSPIGGSSYVPLPTVIAAKKAVKNQQNQDQQCFKWAILARHVKDYYYYRVGTNYSNEEHHCNFSVIHFPTPVSEKKIKKKNNTDVSVNVYGLKLEKKDKKFVHTVHPLKVVDEENPGHFDLLLISDNENAHYTYIFNFSRLIRSQQIGHEKHVYFYKRCFITFSNQKNKRWPVRRLSINTKLIYGSCKPILPVMPAEETKVEFEAWNETLHPIVIFANFEILLEKVKENQEKNNNVPSSLADEMDF